VAFRCGGGQRARLSEHRGLSQDSPEVLRGVEQVLKYGAGVGAMSWGGWRWTVAKVRRERPKHKAMSYERMVEQEKAIRQQVKEMLEQAEAVDAKEDERYGKECAGEELPEELQRRETRLSGFGRRSGRWEERARRRRRRKAGGGDSAARKRRISTTSRSGVTDHEEQQRRVRASIQRGRSWWSRSYS